MVIHTGNNYSCQKGCQEVTSKRNVSFLENALFLSWAIALIATLGSLYFSEVMKFPPCEYCWYQRILMYPLVIILAIAVIKKNNQIYMYVLPFSILGIGISFFHYLKQKLPYFQSAGDTCGLIPCTTQYINWLGFITIPFLALTAFILITLLQFFLWKSDR